LALKTDFEAWGLRKLDSSESEYITSIINLRTGN
jgi:hypothetical protein